MVSPGRVIPSDRDYHRRHLAVSSTHIAIWSGSVCSARRILPPAAGTS